jgi:hypothetical protein
LKKRISFFSDILDAVKKNTQFYCIMGVAATAGAEAIAEAPRSVMRDVS